MKLKPHLRFWFVACSSLDTCLDVANKLRSRGKHVVDVLDDEEGIDRLRRYGSKVVLFIFEDGYEKTFPKTNALRRNTFGKTDFTVLSQLR